jgi:hypothetical protein
MAIFQIRNPIFFSFFSIFPLEKVIFCITLPVNRSVCFMKRSVITFKADEEMMAELEKIPNKSEFIRAAVYSALQETCPFCGGTGTLSPHQKLHWTKFMQEHQVERCTQCNGVKLNCLHKKGE